MELAIDAIMVLVGIFLVIWYTVRGFVKSAMGFARLGLAVALSYIFTPLFSFWQINIFVKYLLVFIVAFGLLILLTFLLDKLFQAKGLKELNRLFGFLLGIAAAYIVMSIIAAVITGLFAYETFANEIGMSQADFAARTFVYRFFNKYGVFYFVRISA